MKKATIIDVASEAGVSVATVSRVMRNEDSVRPVTKERVLAAVKKLNYQPNALARQFRAQETHTVIVIVPDISNSFFHNILFAIEEEAAASGYYVLTADMHNQISIENHYLEAIQQHQVDGVISMSATIAEELRKQGGSDCPIVVTCQYLDTSHAPMANVTIDNESAAKMMVQHLIRMGHTSIAHLTSSEDSLIYLDRTKGYTAALTAHNIPVDEELIIRGTPSIVGGIDQAEALLATGKKFTAIFAAGDVMAIGAIKALRKAGFRVPEDYAVAGFDDIELSALWEPSLTTIRQPQKEIGRRAFQKLLKLMRGDSILYPQEVLPYELVIRESCGYYQNLSKGE